MHSMAKVQRSSASRWRALLAPWRETASSLAQLLHAPTEPDFCSDVALARGGRVWLAWEPNREPEALRSELQVMELLDLLARVSREAFEELVVVVCGEKEARQLLYHTTRSDKDEIVNFRFGYHVDVSYREMLASAEIQRLLTGYGDAEHEGTFLGVKKALLQAWKDTHGADFDRLESPVPIMLDCAQVSLGCDTQWLFRLVQVISLQSSVLVDAIKQRDTEREDGLRIFTFVDTEPVFRVQFVRISLNRDLDSPRQALTLLARIAELGVEISYLRIRSIYLSQVEPATVVQCLHALFAPTQNPSVRCSTEVSMPVGGVRHLVLDFFVEYYVFRRLCSAIMHSQTLAELTLVEDPQIQDEIEAEEDDFFSEKRMRWLGFTLFSSDSTHVIETLRFPSDAFFATRFAMFGFIAQPPFSILNLDLDFMDRDLVLFADVPRLTEVWLRRPQARAPRSGTPFVHFGQGLENVRVLARESEGETQWMVVLLPGWGEAWINANHTTSSRAFHPGLPRGISHLIAEGVSSEAIGDVVDLVKSIPTPILKLSLVGRDSQLSAVSLTKMLTACPELEELHLCNVLLGSIGPIFDGYKARSSRLKTLSLSNMKLPKTDFVECFVTCITDPAHPCRSHLRELVVERVFGDDAYGVGHILNKQFAELLDRCPQLYKFHIIAAQYFTTDLDENAFQFQQREGENMGICQRPLPIASKVAFLSCLKAGSTSMASDVVALILQFAAVPVLKKCAIHFDTRDGDSDESEGSGEENWAEGWDEETGIY